MGFSDTIAGLGRALLGGVEFVGKEVLKPALETFGPPLAQALATRAAQEILPGSTIQVQRAPAGTGSGGGVVSVPRRPLPSDPVPIMRQPTVRQIGFDPDPAPIVSAFQRGAPMPSFPSGGVVPAQLVQAGQVVPGPGFFDLPGIDIVRQGGAGVLGALTAPFRATMAGAAPQIHVQANPATGRLTWFRPAGRPLIWSGDFTAARRLSRVAGRARRRRPR